MSKDFEVQGEGGDLFADGADEAASGRAWGAWLNGVFATEAVA